jgi:hypothetical protein
MKNGKNCHCALIGCNRSKSSSAAAKNQSNFGAKKKVISRERNFSIAKRTWLGKRRVETLQ